MADSHDGRRAFEIRHEPLAFTNCGRAATPGPVCEPSIVTTGYVTGGAIDIADGCVRFVGWEELPHINSEETMSEWRVVARLVMSDATARELAAALRRALTRDGH